MKICLSQIPEKDRQPYIREEANNRVYNKIKQQINVIKELRRI